MVQQSTIQLNVNVDDQNWSQKHVALMQQLATSQPGGFLADAQKALTATGTADVTNPAELAAKIAEFERVGEALGDLGLDLGKLQMQINQGIAHFSLKGTTPVDEGKLQAEQAGKKLFDGLTGLIPGGGLLQAFKGMGMIGVGVTAVLGIAGFVKQMFGHSQIMSTYMGAFMKIFGHFIDVLLLPMLPLLNRVLIWLITEVLPYIRKVSEGPEVVKKDIDEIKKNVSDFGKIVFEGVDPETGEKLSPIERAKGAAGGLGEILGSVVDFGEELPAPFNWLLNPPGSILRNVQETSGFGGTLANMGTGFAQGGFFGGLRGLGASMNLPGPLEDIFNPLDFINRQIDRVPFLEQGLGVMGAVTNPVGAATGIGSNLIANQIREPMEDAFRNVFNFVSPWNISDNDETADVAGINLPTQDDILFANLSPLPATAREPNPFRDEFRELREQNVREPVAVSSTSITNVGEVNFFVTSLQDIRETIESAKNFLENDAELKTAGTTTFG